MTTVLSIAYPFAPVGPNLVGGAEQILWDLDQAIVAAGNTSVVVACEGSKPAGRLIPVPLPERNSLDDADQEWCRSQFHAAIRRALASERIDLVHVHSMDLFGYEFPPDLPLLITLHLPVEWYPQHAMAKYRGRAKFCYVSETQRRAGVAAFGDAPVIENGVEVEAFDGEVKKSNFALVMGRICPEKNAHSALEAATKAGIRVIIGGNVYPYRAHQQYFEDKIEPQLKKRSSTSDHEFAGPLSPERRQRLLAEAKCLLHPTLAPETSSLVAMEALAAGTPVIAYRSGALPEIIEDGVTGFLVGGVDEMAEAIHKVDALSPVKCHEAAEKRFSKKKMIDRYFDLYGRMLWRDAPHCQKAAEYRLLRNTDELSNFVPSWRTLWARDPYSSPFQSPEWLMPWWHQFGSDELCAVVIERGGEAIGLLPFYVYRDAARCKRQLLPLGVGTTDYLDGVFAPECRRIEICRAVEVLRGSVEHDELCATQLPRHSRLLEALRVGIENRSGEAGSSVALSDGCSRMAAVTMGELPQKIRRNAMYYRNRAQRNGRLELVQAAESNWEEIFEDLRRLHTSRWQTRGEDGVLADESVVRWHREAIPLLLRAGLLRLMALKLDGESIAVLYSLIDGEKDGGNRNERSQYFYITAYSPEHAELRPGTLLIAYGIERAAEEGVATIDMLRGDEEYKQIWHMEKEPTWCATMIAPQVEESVEDKFRQTAA